MRWRRAQQALQARRGHVQRGGWAAWVALWSARVYEKNLHACAVLTSPSPAFSLVHPSARSALQPPGPVWICLSFRLRGTSCIEAEYDTGAASRVGYARQLRQWCCSVLKRAVRAWTSFVAAAVAKQQRLADAVALCRARSLHEAACQWLRVGTRRRQLRLDAAVEQQAHLARVMYVRVAPYAMRWKHRALHRSREEAMAARPLAGRPYASQAAHTNLHHPLPYPFRPAPRLIAAPMAPPDLASWAAAPVPSAALPGALSGATSAHIHDAFSTAFSGVALPAVAAASPHKAAPLAAPEPLAMPSPLPGLDPPPASTRPLFVPPPPCTRPAPRRPTILFSTPLMVNAAGLAACTAAPLSDNLMLAVAGQLRGAPAASSASHNPATLPARASHCTCFDPAPFCPQLVTPPHTRPPPPTHTRHTRPTLRLHPPHAPPPSAPVTRHMPHLLRPAPGHTRPPPHARTHHPACPTSPAPTSTTHANHAIPHARPQQPPSSAQPVTLHPERLQLQPSPVRLQLSEEEMGFQSAQLQFDDSRERRRTGSGGASSRDPATVAAQSPEEHDVEPRQASAHGGSSVPDDLAGERARALEGGSRCRHKESSRTHREAGTQRHERNSLLDQRECPGATAAKEEGRAKSEEEAVREDEVAAMERVLEGFELLKADIARCQEDLEEARASWREAAEEEDHKGSSVAECWHQSQQEVMGAVERRVAALEEELAELHSQRRERVPMVRSVLARIKELRACGVVH
ncbi:hypothetical protein CYMTET_29250 [Cymbomonas tetramitiformis]|uniref:Uncharacterized protein n=1 Tax=Cymbomonas tetramitiformis TaxID=36881 RepID=A0AAE0FLG5_9CHLO|nr:hypothetical protein CYMTET_29250 [Cymbomonas tetramitiformis]